MQNNKDGSLDQSPEILFILYQDLKFIAVFQMHFGGIEGKVFMM